MSLEIVIVGITYLEPGDNIFVFELESSHTIIDYCISQGTCDWGPLEADGYVKQTAFDKDDLEGGIEPMVEVIKPFAICEFNAIEEDGVEQDRLLG